MPPEDADDETKEYENFLSLKGVDPTQLVEDESGRIQAIVALSDVTNLEPLTGYTLTDTLGKGGMGIVNAARQVSLGREVAVKTLRKGKDSRLHRERLVQEARVTGQLEHPNIVPVHDLGMSPLGKPMFVMKRIEGLPWTDWLERPTPEQYQQMAEVGGPRIYHLRVLSQVCNAVAFAHSRGFLHRDLKPDNVMIGNFGEIYVVDWGIAISLEEASMGDPSLAGTPAYMAPEAAGGLPLDPRSDVFQLGSMLYRILAGHGPRKKGPPLKVLAKAWKGERLPLPEDVPRGLSRIVERALATDRDVRYGSVKAFQRDIQDFIRVQPLFALVERARQSATTALEELGKEEPDPEAVDRLSNEARVALDQLRSEVKLPGLEEARVELLQALFAFEVERGRQAVAELILDELGPNATDTQRGAAARMGRRAESRKLQEREKVVARETAIARQQASIALGVGHTLAWLLVGFWSLVSPLPLMARGMGAVAMVALPLGMLAVFRNPRMVPAVGVLAIGGLLSLGTPPEATWFFLSAVAALTHGMLYWADDPDEVKGPQAP